MIELSHPELLWKFIQGYLIILALEICGVVSYMSWPVIGKTNTSRPVHEINSLH
jgi:hypothetical protein